MNRREHARELANRILANLEELALFVGIDEEQSEEMNNISAFIENDLLHYMDRGDELIRTCTIHSISSLTCIECMKGIVILPVGIGGHPNPRYSLSSMPNEYENNSKLKIVTELSGSDLLPENCTS